MSLARAAAIAALKATDWLGGEDFLEKAGISTPVPDVPGVIPAVAREPFYARDLKRLFDLIVIFRIGDFADNADCSTYYDPSSPWYNVFYGAYGLKSYKRDGSAVGFHPDGTANYDEILQVPFTDYNFLTAGALGCPPEKMSFQIQSLTEGQERGWRTAEVLVTIPSGLHAKHDAVKPDVTFYLAFGHPADRFMQGRTSYEPVSMIGKMYFKAIQPRLTLVWGGLTPATPGGEQLLGKIVDVMSPLYL